MHRGKGGGKDGCSTFTATEGHEAHERKSLVPLGQVSTLRSGTDAVSKNWGYTTQQLIGRAMHRCSVAVSCGLCAAAYLLVPIRVNLGQAGVVGLGLARAMLLFLINVRHSQGLVPVKGRQQGQRRVRQERT